MYPRLVYHAEALAENVQRVASRCSREGITLWGVTKGVCAQPEIARIMVRNGCRALMDSRMRNLRALKAQDLGVPLWLLRIPMSSEIPEIVEHADGAVISMAESVHLLHQACAQRRHPFEVMLMVDIGDLREGIWPDEVDALAEAFSACPRVRCIGVGANWGCYGGVLPTEENEKKLLSVGRLLEGRLGQPLTYFSGGNSSALSLLENGGLPSRINHLRVGEAILLGTDVTNMRSFPWLRQDTMEFQAEIVELRRKPSVPLGKRGADAFGNVPEFEDRGYRLRAIVALGRQDVRPEGLTPLDPRMTILGASSDHMILDVEDADPLKVGEVLSFRPDYGAMLQGATSAYVEKCVLEEPSEL